MTNSSAPITDRDEPRLLLIDDEPAILASFALAFGDQGWAVTTADSGEEALAMYEPGAYELVITDKNLPGMSGVDVVSEIRRSDAAVTIMMLTGFGSISSAADTLNAGVDAYVEKPVRDVIRLTARAKAIIRRRQKQRELARTASCSPPNPFEVLLLSSNQACAKLVSADLIGLVDTVSVAANVEEMRSAVRDRAFGLILVEDGIAKLCDAIEATKNESRTPIAVLGQHLGLDTIMSLVDMGIAACIVLPVGSPQCAERIGELIKGFRRDTGVQRASSQSE